MCVCVCVCIYIYIYILKLKTVVLYLTIMTSTGVRSAFANGIRNWFPESFSRSFFVTSVNRYFNNHKVMDQKFDL